MQTNVVDCHVCVGDPLLVNLSAPSLPALAMQGSKLRRGCDESRSADGWRLITGTACHSSVVGHECWWRIQGREQVTNTWGMVDNPLRDDGRRSTVGIGKCNKKNPGKNDHEEKKKQQRKARRTNDSERCAWRTPIDPQQRHGHEHIDVAGTIIANCLSWWVVC